MIKEREELRHQNFLLCLSSKNSLNFNGQLLITLNWTPDQVFLLAISSGKIKIKSVRVSL